MSKIKNFYHEQISEGLTEVNDKFSDDEYQINHDKCGNNKCKCGGKCKCGENVICQTVKETIKQ